MLTDPLEGYRWADLHKRYDDRCKARFSVKSKVLTCLGLAAGTDRTLYYELVERLRGELDGSGQLSGETYLGILFWKFYALPTPVPRCIEDGWRPDSNQLNCLSQTLRETMGDGVDELMNRLERLKDLNMWYLGSRRRTGGLPARTTFLHITFPDKVPIVDKQVLTAVGVAQEGANQDIAVYRKYLPHARKLACKHQPRFSPLQCRETPLRLIDMALWILRGEQKPRASLDKAAQCGGDSGNG